jgi:2-oxoglutarate ferredoxin oxidoreductase subunit alpha
MNKNDLSIVLCGEAGQGIQTVEHILTRGFKLSGFNVFSTTEFMSRVRGGCNSTEIRISNERANAFVDRIDILVSFSKCAIPHLRKRISPQTIIVGEKENIEKEDYQKYNIWEAPFSKMATEIGSKVYTNTVAVGAIAGLLKVEPEIIEGFLKEQFSRKGEEIVQKNIEAVRKGYEIGDGFIKAGGFNTEIEKNPKLKNEMLLNGTEAVAFGAIAGGCQFLSFYPMSPSTGVAVFLAQQGQDFDLIVEQAEDEIAAMNMVLGAWYAGARAMVTTSGGGFALMVEGLSLAGIMETPVVIHLGQRPGGATGLATRTEQADLNLVLYAGHGEFPRIIFAPSNIEDAFYLTQQAFNLADKYQVPVFILTDQYFVDSYYNFPAIDLFRIEIERHIVKTEKDYQRYRFTPSGVSSRSVPGFGEGIVVCAGNEHDEIGHITEDPVLRTKMVNKRLKKLELIKKEAIPPDLLGNKDYNTLIIGWGSTYHVVKEALQELGKEDISLLHFKQVYPLAAETVDYLKRAKKRVIVENNATAQFGNLLKLYTGLEIDAKILKYSGRPFSVEELGQRIKEVI